MLIEDIRSIILPAGWLSQEVPGFAEALAWPETPLVTSPRGGRAAGAPGAKQAASDSADELADVHELARMYAESAEDLRTQCLQLF